MAYPSGSGAGLCWSLLEASEILGDARYRRAARRALDYYADDAKYCNPISCWTVGEGFTFWDVSFCSISYFLRAYSKAFEVFQEDRYVRAFRKFLSFLLVMAWHYETDPFWLKSKQPLPVAGLWSTINSLEVTFCGEAQGMILALSELLPFILEHADVHTYRELVWHTYAASRHVLGGFRVDFPEWGIPGSASHDWQIPIEGANPNRNLLVVPKTLSTARSRRSKRSAC